MKKVIVGAIIVSTLALLGILGMHIFGAAFWGSWDQDGIGSTGFWPTFKAGSQNIWWIYALFASIIVTAGFLLKRDKKNTLRVKG